MRERKSWEAIQMGKFMRAIVAFIFVFDGLAVFWENLHDGLGYYVGLGNFMKFFHMKGSSPILLLASIIIPLIVAIFFFWGKKMPMLIVLFVYCIYNIIKSILTVHLYFQAGQIDHIIGAIETNFLYWFELIELGLSPYIIKSMSYFILLLCILAFMMDKSKFSNVIKKFWWMPGVLRCCSGFLFIYHLYWRFGDIEYMFSYLFSDFFRRNIQIPMLMIVMAYCQAMELFLLGWWLTNQNQKRMENIK